MRFVRQKLIKTTIETDSVEHKKKKHPPTTLFILTEFGDHYLRVFDAISAHVCVCVRFSCSPF